jgi:glycosyltransferase involved in cell wall biosynthesis
MISTVILTLNEELDLPGCLAAIPWCDDIHILDSGSTDRTLDIARAHGVTIHHRDFDTFAGQRNASLALPFRHPWVLVLDADERPTPALSAEMQQAVAAAPATIAAFRLRRRDFLWGRWLRHAQMTPFYTRLLRPNRAHYTRAVNEVITVHGAIGLLHATLDHLAFSKGLTHWVAKHNDYSSREAHLLLTGDATRSASLRQALFAPTLSERRVAQKALYYKLPLRPAIKWAWLMFVRGAVLDGHAGLTYATLMSYYEYLIELKYRELLQTKK